jgi:multidrug efflux pump subunit AcrB
VLARFFIDRPVLAWVISIVIILLGAIAAELLPIAEYPEVSPPTVRVSANYPGLPTGSQTTYRVRTVYCLRLTARKESGGGVKKPF